ncbi:arsenate reductase (glutaredoxin) [Zhengella sp. ZM62]|uniref:arsenate reductase (glutaredoxin) n=1 Tax=Zhengella sedimenti TaxID=3390035 RepID=UPI0039751CC5
MDVTIYHNPRCSKSRQALALLQEKGIEPRVVEYLKTPPTRDELAALVKATGEPVRALLRKQGSPYEELGLDDEKWSDDELLDFMAGHPSLLNRPVVVTEKGARLGRPTERILEIL